MFFFWLFSYQHHLQDLSTEAATDSDFEEMTEIPLRWAEGGEESRSRNEKLPSHHTFSLSSTVGEVGHYHEQCVKRLRTICYVPFITILRLSCFSFSVCGGCIIGGLSQKPNINQIEIRSSDLFTCQAHILYRSLSTGCINDYFTQ